MKVAYANPPPLVFTPLKACVPLMVSCALDKPPITPSTVTQVDTPSSEVDRGRLGEPMTTSQRRIAPGDGSHSADAAAVFYEQFGLARKSETAR